MTRAATSQTGEPPEITACFAALTNFCRERGAKLFAAFTPEVLADYLRFHVHHGTLAFVRATTPTDAILHPPSSILALAVAWPANRADLEAALRTTNHAFNWQPPSAQPDCAFVAEVVAVDLAHALSALRHLAQRWPQCRDLPKLTVRHGKLCEHVHGRFQPL